MISLTYTDLVVPYVRVGRERWTARAMRYLASKDALATAIRQAAAAVGHDQPDAESRFAVSIHVTRKTRRAYDLDNVVKALMDSANGIIWKDDAQVDQIRADKYQTAPVPDLLTVVFSPLPR